MADLSDFSRGFICGLVVAGILGYIVQQIRFAHKTMGAPDRPQTVTLKTEKTPRQVVREGSVAALRFWFWLMMLVMAIIALWRWLPR